MADIICNGPVTRQHVEEILQKYFKTDAKLAKASGEIISVGLGFTSDVMRVDLEWEVKDGLPTRVIVKAPKLENIAFLMEKFTGETGKEAIEQSMKFVPMIHETECKAYNLLSIYNPIPIPKIYGYWLVGEKNPGVIIMEDLGKRAGIIDNVATGLNLNQWRSILECLADLQAWSLTTDVPWQNEISDMQQGEEFFKNFIKGLPFAIKQTKEKFAEYFSDLDEEKILGVLTLEKMMESTSVHKNVMPDVIQHGDTWINNIMFEKNPDGTIGDKVYAFIDWQISLRGSAVNDIARFTCWCVNHELRRANETKMLRYYYDRLKSKCGDKLSATFEQIESLYKDAAAGNGLFGVTMIEFIVENIGKAHEDPTGWRRKELLDRMRAGYEDAAKFFGWPVKQLTTNETSL